MSKDETEETHAFWNRISYDWDIRWEIWEIPTGP